MDFEQRVTIEVTAGDLLAISNALNEVCHGPDSIPDWEFRTRIGVARDAANQTLRQIRDAFDRVHQHP